MPEAVVDGRVLAVLAGELEDLAAALAIADRYRENLLHRVTRLDLACSTGDLESAMDAVLSLKVSSATVGATRMRRCAEVVEARLLAGDCRADLAMERVRCSTARTLEAFERVLGRCRAGQTTGQTASGSSIR